MKLIINTDGGARGNPGPAACGFVVHDAACSLLHAQGKFLGETTNNVAEYMAVIEGLKWIKDKFQVPSSKFQTNSPPKADQPLAENDKNLKNEITIKTDSLLIASQLQGVWKIKDRNLQKLVMEVKKLEREAGCVIRYQHIPRELNKEADRIVNETLDRN